jgi:Flp pilus assembly pilin Flp
LNILLSEDGQDVAEYAILAALILIVMMATIRLIGANASNIFSQVGSAIE